MNIQWKSTFIIPGAISCNGDYSEATYFIYFLGMFFNSDNAVCAPKVWKTTPQLSADLGND